MATKEKQLIVIGAGPGGYAAAFMAADLGLSVTIVDPEENPGGVCLYRGCIPTKALLNTVKLLHDGKHAGSFGIDFGEPTIDINKIRDHIENVVEQLTSGVGGLAKRRKIEYIRGKAAFSGPKRLTVEQTDGTTKKLTFKTAILATGSRPAELPHVSFDSPHVWSSSKALQLPKIPKRFLVVGAGYIGLELGYSYASLGSEVSVVELMPEIMPGADRDIVSVFQKSTKSLFSTIMTETSVAEIEEKKDGIVVTFEGKNAPDKPVSFDTLLLTVGRNPNTEGIGIENTAVELTDKGFVKVDKELRTADSSIFAVGDVNGPPLLAHKASHEGRVAAEIIAGKKAAFDPRAIPAVEYTEPEIAWCGLTEREAKEQNREVRIAKFPWAASGRAATLGTKEGLTKLIIDPETERILGGAIVGTHAGELISELTLAIEMGARVSDISLTIHPHPTLSETIMEAAEAFFGRSTHIYRPKR